eukprot:6003014-Prymnesium_polylepis.1
MVRKKRTMSGPVDMSVGALQPTTIQSVDMACRPILKRGMPSKKSALADAQGVLDAAASGGEIQEGAYMRLSNSLMRVNKCMDKSVRDIRLDMFADMAISNPYSANAYIEDVFMLDPEVVSRVLERGKDESE